MKNIADLVNPETGNTYRRDNLNTRHQYKVGEMVELDHEGWVKITKLTRDCDGTPLYSYEKNGLPEDCIVDDLRD